MKHVSNLHTAKYHGTWIFIDMWGAVFCWSRHYFLNLRGCWHDLLGPTDARSFGSPYVPGSGTHGCGGGSFEGAYSQQRNVTVVGMGWWWMVWWLGMLPNVLVLWVPCSFISCGSPWLLCRSDFGIVISPSRRAILWNLMQTHSALKLTGSFQHWIRGSAGCWDELRWRSKLGLKMWASWPMSLWARNHLLNIGLWFYDGLCLFILIDVPQLSNFSVVFFLSKTDLSTSCPPMS